MTEIREDFVFSSTEKAHMVSCLSQITENPYRDYEAFDGAIDHAISLGAVVEGFATVCDAKRQADLFDDPYFLMRNCPIDPSLPVLDFNDAVNDKRTRKTTYVSEGFLLLYAKLMGQEPIGYVNVNDGDVFQDIHPLKKLSETQSQKAITPINFHKDLANHFVRPDWVNILGLRSSPENVVNTSFVSNKELLERLPEDIQTTLREEIFQTPYDDLTVATSNVDLGEAPAHRILGGATDYDIRFFENRTIGLNEDAAQAVSVLVATLHDIKRPVRVLSGDFIGSANNECIHNKEFGEIRDREALQHRWLQKTVNVRSLEHHSAHMVPGSLRIVNG